MKFSWLRTNGNGTDVRSAAVRRFRSSGDVVSTAHGAKTVLLNLRSETFYSLDEVGAAIWAALREPATIDGIVERLAQAYDAPAEELRADVRTFVADLVGAGLAEEV